MTSSPVTPWPPRRVWVDLANSPQVQFFVPFLRKWQEQGIETLVTARSYAQTESLAEQHRLTYDLIGAHGGSSLLGLGSGLLARAGVLRTWARDRSIDLAISHNSYAQLLAARPLGIRSVTAMDFEHHWANHFAFRLADRVVVPAPFPDAALRWFGARSKTIRYPGIKEQLYLAGNVDTADFRVRHGLRQDAVLVVVRPAAVGAAYHRHANPLVGALLDHLAGFAGIDLVFLPRDKQTATGLGKEWKGRAFVPDGAWDGHGLLKEADLVFSGGGTMVREAAVLGTPAFSLFSGKSLAVDEYLARLGRLTFLRTLGDVRAIVPRRKAPGMGLLLANDDLFQCVSMALLGHPSPPCQPAAAIS